MADETSLSVGVPRETFPGERRVALTPNALPALTKVGVRIIVESGAGTEAGFFDEAYQHHGAEIGSRADAFGADIVLQVRTYPANPDAGKADLDLLRPDQLVIGLANPLANPEAVAELARRKATCFAMELVPRITRAQSMDALSSQANIGGYKAVIRAARLLPKMMPMMTTAAGTIPPAKVFVLGVGVAGLQVVATAQVPGRKASVLVTADMVHGMAPGSVIVDMAAGQGGNVELSQPDREVVVNGVTIDGPTNLPSTVPVHASMTYAKNLTAFLMNMYNGKERVLRIDPDDEIVRESLVARGGEVTNTRVRQALGLADAVREPPPTAPVAAAMA